MKEAIGGQSLLSIFGVYEKMKGRTASATGSTPAAAPPQSSSSSSTMHSASSSAPPPGSAPTSSSTPDSKAEAESLKSKGNASMASKDYPSAIDLYTRALILSPSNPIYLSNRAAAYSASAQHERAVTDAELATTTDPSYSKGWSRLGLAKFALGDAKGSMEAYQRGIQAEGSGGSEQMKRGFETAKRRVDDEAGSSGGGTAAANRSTSPPAGAGAGGMPDLAGLASMLGGAGGAGAGGGGAPGGFDFASIMQNPMFAQMAQSVMSNPGMMEGIMNNPRMREMADRVGGAGAGGAGGSGGAPDIAAMMQDPSIAEMARNFMGGGAGRGRGAGGS